VRAPRLRAPLVSALLVMTLVALQGQAAEPVERHARAWVIMGTALEVTLHADSNAAEAAFAAVFRDAARVDSLMSLYRPESELCRVNREAFEKVVALSPETSEVIAAALDFHESTGGAFDITVKPMMDAWGFYRRSNRLPSPAIQDSLVALSGRDRILFDREARTIRFLSEGVELDLGGIAKGYAVDLMARSLKNLAIRSALVNLGGNMRAIGTPPGNPAGWPVGIRDPAEPDSLLHELTLRDRSISSSGDYENFVVIEGSRFGHIIDPRTAWPVEAMAGTTVLAGDALTADVLSTALFVLGPVDGLAWARDHSEVEVLLVSIDKVRNAPLYRGTGVFGALEGP
jgi:thiamine biosynthesis lipoprotein